LIAIVSFVSITYEQPATSPAILSVSFTALSTAIHGMPAICRRQFESLNRNATSRHSLSRAYNECKWRPLVANRVAVTMSVIITNAYWLGLVTSPLASNTIRYIWTVKRSGSAGRCFDLCAWAQCTSPGELNTLSLRVGNVVGTQIRQVILCIH